MTLSTHLQKAAQMFLEEKEVFWWCIPAECSDLNPIENLRYELKEYMRREVKPTTKQELISGIKEMWETVTEEMCAKYIRHLRKIISKVIKPQGNATGYF